MLRHLALLSLLALLLPGCPDGSGLVTTGDDDAGDDDAGDDDAGDDDTGDDDTGPPGELELSLHDEFESLIVVRWDQAQAGEATVEYAHGDGDWAHTPARHFEEGPAEQIVVGVPYTTEARVRLVRDPGGAAETTEQQSITTGDPPPGMPLPELLHGDPDGWDPSMPYVFAAVDNGEWDFGDFWTMIVDRAGRVVWARTTPTQYVSLYPRPAVDGRSLLIDHNTFWTQWDSGAGSQVIRLKLDGTELATYDTPGLHHPFTELTDGTLVWGAVTGYANETLEELRPDGGRDTIWDCTDWYDEIGWNGDCVSNTVYWHEPTDTFLFSFWTSETVVEIDHATGQTLRWFGRAEGSYTFDPLQSQFWWQHGAQITDDGHLLLSAHVSNWGYETVVREYAIDDASETLHEVWNFGVGAGVYGDQMGEVHRLDGGNTLHNYGTLPRLRECTPDGTVVWDLEWDKAGSVGRSTPVAELYPMLP